MSGLEMLTDRSRKALALANQESLRLDQNHIGQEHILLGIVKEGRGNGARILKDYGLDLRVVRMKVEDGIESNEESVRTTGRLPYDPTASESLARAIELAKERGDLGVDTAHLGYGILVTPGPGRNILICSNVTEKAYVQQIDEIARQSSSDVQPTGRFWNIPRDVLTFTQVLGSMNYMLVPFAEEGDRGVAIIDISGRSEKIVGESAESGETVIYYNSDLVQQVKANTFRTFLSKNDVSYEERYL